jgi:hypothetical protein
MSTVNAVTIFAENLRTANVIVGNSSSNLTITANSISVRVGNNLTINSSTILVSNASAPAFNTAINSISISTSKITLANVDYTTIAPQTPMVDYQVFTSPVADNKWYKPSWAQANDIVTIMMWGGGGSGGVSFIGGGGGACVVANRLAGECNSVCNVVVGAAGILSDGGNSIFWANSSFNITSYGGKRGGGNGTGSGGGWFGVGNTTFGGSPLGGGTAFNGGDSTFGGGGPTSEGGRGGSSVYGGGGGGQAQGGNSIYGGAGGAAAGNIAGVSIFGGNGGLGSSAGIAPGGGGGSANANGGRGEVRIWTTASAIGGDSTPQYFLVPNTSTVPEGNSVSFTVSTFNVADGTTLYYTLNNSSQATSADFTTAVNGSIVINGGSNTFVLTDNAASTNVETFYMDLRTGSSTGTIVANSSSVTLGQANVQQLFTSNGSFEVPTGITNVSIVCVGGGAAGNNTNADGGRGGGGGALSYTNNLAVTPGETLTIVVGLGGTTSGQNGGDSYVRRSSTDLVLAKGGVGGTTSLGGNSALGVGTVKYSGGNGGSGFDGPGGGGGGAAGYSGNGGNGSNAEGGLSGAGAGGSASGGAGKAPGGDGAGGGGGGVGLLGEGSSGTSVSSGAGGIGGSGGANGANGVTTTAGSGGLYGGGGGGAPIAAGGGVFGNGANGAVRIIWGENRAFPDTNTTDL